MLKNGSIIKETLRFLFKDNHGSPVGIKSALLDIYTTAQLDNDDVGTCICPGGWGKHRGLILRELTIRKDLRIEADGKNIAAILPAGYIQSLYLAICSAMSRSYLVDLIKKQVNRPMPPINQKSDIVVQIGFMYNGFLDYRSIKRLFVFDKGIHEHSRSREAKDRYERIKKINKNISFDFADELAVRQKILQEADVMIITGSTLTNGSLDVILRNCKRAREIVISGRSCAIHPEALFKRNVTYVCSSVPPNNLLDLAVNDYGRYISLGQPGKEYFLGRDN